MSHCVLFPSVWCVIFFLLRLNAICCIVSFFSQCVSLPFLASHRVPCVSLHFVASACCCAFVCLALSFCVSCLVLLCDDFSYCVLFRFVILCLVFLNLSRCVLFGLLSDIFSVSRYTSLSTFVVSVSRCVLLHLVVSLQSASAVNMEGFKHVLWFTLFSEKRLLPVISATTNHHVDVQMVQREFSSSHTHTHTLILYHMKPVM